MNNQILWGAEFEFVSLEPNDYKIKEVFLKEMKKKGIPFGFSKRHGFELKDDCSIHYADNSHNDNVNQDDYYGAELVTPPMYLTDFRKYCSAIQHIIQKNKNFLTNDTCGLHISCSFQNYNLTKEMSPAVLLFSFDEKRLTKMWGRHKNTYCQPSQKDVIGELCSEDGEVFLFRRDYRWKLMDKAVLDVSCDSTAVAFWHLLHPISIDQYPRSYDRSDWKDSRVEFRFAGGKNYERKHEEFNESIRSIKEAMLKSIDPKFKGATTRKISKLCQKKLRKKWKLQ